MSLRDEIANKMPALLVHEGFWYGVYRVVNANGEIIDQHESRVECVFPDNGPFHYYQRNHFRWSDGRTVDVEFGGVLKGERMFWDTETFSGYGWVTGDDVIFLTLDRKDRPGAKFTEVIIPGPDLQHRARTWHWFEDGKLLQRTLCDESRDGRDFASQVS